jgi:hypothetical protein
MGVFAAIRARNTWWSVELIMTFAMYKVIMYKAFLWEYYGIIKVRLRMHAPGLATFLVHAPKC